MEGAGGCGCSGVAAAGALRPTSPCSAVVELEFEDELEEAMGVA